MPEIMPAVSLMTPSPKVPSIVADDAGGTRQAVEHLLSLRHKRIACLMMTYTPLPQRRLQGYHAAMMEAGIKPARSWVRSLAMDPNQDSPRGLARWNMEQWLADGWKKLGCTALLVQNDRMALGVLDALRAAGIDVPGEVSVVGFDGTEDCESATPCLTSVGVPLRRIGAAGIQNLLRQVGGERSEPDTLVLPTHLQVRDSTGPAPSAPRRGALL
jgi:LacI family transcriptional regulator